MTKPKNKLSERRGYLRLETPIDMSYTVPSRNRTYKAITKNISAEGMRFETRDEDLKESDSAELKLNFTGAHNPVHANAKIVWKKKLSLEDGAPFDVGLEFTEIEEDNKNTFLKFLCDLIYNLPKENKR